MMVNSLCGRRLGTGAHVPAVLALVAAVLIAGCSPKKDDASNANPSNVVLTQAQRAHVRLFTVKSVGFHKSIETSGVVDFDNDRATSVLAPFSGPVSRLSVSLGQKVTKGQVLAVVNSSDFAAAVGAYRKARAAALAARRLADLDKDLLAHHGVSQREAEQAESDAVGAESDRDAALQTLTSLDADPRTIKELQQGKPTPRLEGYIRSPIAGTVVERLVTPGQLLTAGTTPCFTVADLSRVWVMAQVFGTDLESVHPGDSAEIETGPGARNLPGKVDNIAALVDPDTRSVKVRVVADNPGDILKKQMYVRVRIVSGRASSGLLVPVSTILHDDVNLPFVYIAQRDGSFARRRVTLGYRDGDRYQVTSGLKPGTQVVIDGALFLQFMQTQ